MAATVACIIFAVPLLLAIPHATGQPSLSSFSLNLTPPERLLLTFSEIISQSCSAQHLTFQNSATEPSANVTLQSATCVYDFSSGSPNILSLSTESSQWLQVQSDINLATNINNTYVALSEGFCTNVGGIPNVATVLRATQFTPNINPPNLLECTFDQQSRVFGMTFSEGVVLSSLEPTGVSIASINSESGLRQNRTLIGGEVVPVRTGNSQVGIILLSIDYAAISSGTTNPTDFIITLAANSVMDANGMTNPFQSNVMLSVYVVDSQDPSIESYSLDLNVGRICMSFTERINESIDYSLLQLTSNQSEVSPLLSRYDLNGSTTVSLVDEQILTIQIADGPLSSIIADTAICTSTMNCFLLWQNGSFEDLNGNPSVQPLQALRADNVTGDISAPSLESFNINLLTGVLDLTFSELIVVNTLSLSSFLFTGNGSSEVSTISGILQSISTPSNGLSSEITVILSDSSLNFAKALNPLRLAVQGNGASDSSGNIIMPISLANALYPTRIVSDTAPPNLISFSPNNSTSREIVLIFDEIINPLTWNGNMLSLTLQVSTGDFTYSTFTGGTVSSTPSQNLTYTFSDDEFSPPFSNQYSEAYITGAIILRADAGLIEDVSGNALASTITLTFSALPPDQIRPRISNFRLDLNNELLEMTFNEPVHVYPPAGLIIFSNVANTNGSAYQDHVLLGNGTYSQNQTGATLSLFLALASRDLNIIKANNNLCTSADNCYVSVLSNLAMDRSGNMLETGVFRISSFIADTTSPVLLSFTIDLGSTNISLEFSEPIVYSTLTPDLSRFSLIGSTSAQSGLNLSSSIITSASNLNTVFEAVFPQSVFNVLILDPSLCTNTSNCFLRASSSAFEDTSGNQAIEGVVQVGVVFADTVNPSLLSYDLDLDNGMLKLVFNEPISIESFNPMYINFTSRMLPGNSGVTITGAEVTSPEMFSEEVAVIITETTLNSLKVLYSHGADSFGMSISSSAASDVSGNPVLPNGFLPPANVTIDISPPQLLSFRPGFPMNSDIIFLFNEPINASSFQENSFTLFLRIRQGEVTYLGFSGGQTFWNSERSSELIYTFSTADYNMTFREQFQEAIENGSLYLSVTTSFIMDLFQNSVIEVPSSNPLRFTNDTIRPELTNFVLDLNRETINLYFSEPVVVRYVAGLVSIQSSITGGTNYTLIRNGTLLPGGEASNEVIIVLDQVDSLSIISNPAIATSIDNTYIQLEQNFVTDISGNELPSTVLQASVLILDLNSPNVTSFDLDINQGLLNIDFSELISLSTLNLSQVFLTGGIGTQSSRYNLDGSMTSGPMLSTSVTVSLSVNVLNRIKFDTQVCAISSNCFLYIENRAFADLSGNYAQSSNLYSPQSFTPDMTSPALLSFSLDLDSGRIVLNFSEPILESSYRPSQISLYALGQSEQLNGTTIVMVQYYGTEFTLSLDSALLDRVKLLASTGPISLSMTSDALTDTSLNPVVSISPSSAITPSVFTPDTTPPVVIEFTPSAGTPLSFMLVFDEPIQSSSIDTSILGFTLKNRNGHFNYVDLSSAVRSVGTNNLSLTFSPADVRFTGITFQELYLLSYTGGYICFNLAPSFITDVSGNPYSGPMTVIYTNTSDSERPQLLRFSLDLNRGYLNLTFTEDVNILSVVGNARLQSSITLPIIVNLNEERNILYSGTDTISNMVSILLNLTDVAMLINSPSIGSSALNTYLLLQDQFAIDSSGNFLDASDIPVQASQVIQFVVGTTVTQFSLDLDSDILTIDFDKNVNVSTFNSSQIILTDSSSSSLTSNQDRVQLGVVELLIEPGTLVTRFRFLLRDEDAILIKSSSVCSMASACYASFMSGLILDATGNSTRPAFLQVTDLSSDVTPPRLVAYSSFDLNRGAFTLIFSEPVNGSSADFRDIQLWDQDMNPTATVTLIQGETISSDLQVTFFLPSSEVNLIKSLSTLCTSTDNCWIRLLSFFVYDFAGNPFLHSNRNPAASSSLHQPLAFIPDTTPPTLSLFSVDINNGTLYLSFDEVVIDSTFRPQDITLLNMPGGSVSQQLSSSTPITSVGTTQTIFFSFTEVDLNQIKSLSLFTSRTDSYLSFMSTTLVDTSGNLATSISSANALQASSFNMDFNQPQVVSFEQYNNDVGSLVLRFNEPVDINTFVPFELSLYSQPSLDSSHFTLTGGSVSYFTDDGLSVSVTLLFDDLQAIKINTDLATSRDNTYITIGSSAVSDRQGNPVQPLLLPLQVSANGYIPDTSRASLIMYSFDLNNGTVSLTFDDVMDFRTFDIRQITIQNEMMQPTSSYALTSSFSSQLISNILSFQLSETDLNVILSNVKLASSSSNTFISFEETLVRDVSGLPVIPVPSSNGLPPGMYVSDVTPPEISSFNLDLNVGLLQVTFSEPVQVDSIRLSSLFLQTTETTSTNDVFALTSEEFTESGQNTLFLTFNFPAETLNVVKSLGFQSVNSTFLTAEALFGVDTNGNPFRTRTIQVSTYIRDSIPPSLLNFDLNFNQSSTLLQMNFSEAIAYSDSAVQSITLQSAAFNPSIVQHLSLSNTVRTLPSLDAVEVIIMDSSLLFALLNNPGIASSTMNLFMSLSMNGFRDFAGNDVVAVASDSAKRVRYIYLQCFGTGYNDIVEGVCVPCSDVCSSGCTGPMPLVGSGGCNRCHSLTLSRNGSLESCLPEGTGQPASYYIAVNTPYASVADVVYSPCDEDCLSCNGPLSSNCQSCKFAFESSNQDGSILQCLSSCSQSTNPSLCQACHPQCIGCSGPGSHQCISCREASVTIDNTVVCVPVCSGGTYLSRVSESTFEHECRTCHPLCQNCSGPGNQDCMACQEASLVVNEITTCVPQCLDGLYLERISASSFEYQCQRCDSQCRSCRGPGNTNCSSCAAVNYTSNGVSSCLTSCPVDTYESTSNRLCQPCHEQCSGGCRGPSNRNCSACLESSIIISPNVIECTSFSSCSFGMEYDSVNGMCTFSQTIQIVIIVSCVIGGIILLVALLAALFICYKCVNSRGKYKTNGVELVSNSADLEKVDNLESIPL